jgi:hypothetical protein
MSVFGAIIICSTVDVHHVKCCSWRRLLLLDGFIHDCLLIQLLSTIWLDESNEIIRSAYDRSISVLQTNNACIHSLAPFILSVGEDCPPKD